MRKNTVKAYAKLNLSLDVLGKREDGFHSMRMVMQSVDLTDNIEIITDTGGEICVRTNLAYLPNDGRNIAARAADEFAKATGVEYNGLELRIQKRIPVCAGMGGGSSDAAAVLKGLNEMYETGLSVKELMEIGLRLGADVPYCIMGGTALAEGIGEELTALTPIPDCWFVICKPRFSASTPLIFAKLDAQRITQRPDTAGMLAAIECGNLVDMSRHMFNVFEPVVAGEHREIREQQHVLISSGALGASMSGTGPTVFGVFADRGDAERACSELRERERTVFITKPV